MTEKTAIKAALLFCGLALTACGHAPTAPVKPTPKPVQQVPAPGGHYIIPVPATFEATTSDTFTLAPSSIIVAQGGDEAVRIANYLAALIGTTQESAPRVVTLADPTKPVIELALDPNAPAGDEAYDV